jgi:hypothetical protein
VPFRDHSPDAIGVRTLAGGQVEISDRTVKAWVGDEDAALQGPAKLEPATPPGDPSVVWNALANIR